MHKDKMIKSSCFIIIIIEQTRSCMYVKTIGRPNVWHKRYNKTSSWFWNTEARNRISTRSERPWLVSCLHRTDRRLALSAFLTLSHPRRTHTPNTSSIACFSKSIIWFDWTNNWQNPPYKKIYAKRVFIGQNLGFRREERLERHS